MVKYCGHYITFQEVPNEVALVLGITNCPYRCKGCHSPWLQKDFGDELTKEVMLSLLDKYQGAITCVCFMGVGSEPTALDQYISLVHQFGLKVCIYDGDDHGEFLTYELEAGDPDFYPDYYKEGSYKEEFGGLDSVSTNQRMWKMEEDGKYHDITSWFWRKKE